MKQRKLFVYFFLLLLLISVEGNPLKNCNLIYNDVCYELFSSKTADSAENDCKSRNGHLAKITDADMSSELTIEMKRFLGSSVSDSYQYRFWIGLNDTQKEGIFIYNDGTPFSHFNYSKWYSGEPDDRDSSSRYEGDCVSLSAFTQYWYDDSCTSGSKPYVCECRGKCNIPSVKIPNAEFDMCYSNKTVESGKILKVHCMDGFILKGNDYVKCTVNSTWTPFPSCIRGCSKPPSISHALLISEREKYYTNDIATYICDAGYYSSDNIDHSHFTLYCNSGSKWSPGHVTCVAREKYTVEDVVLKPMESTELYCYADINAVDNFQNWLWLKNSENVEYISLSSHMKITGSTPTNLRAFSVEGNGSLTIIQASEITIGYYTCFAVGNSILPGNTSYNIKIATDCIGLRGVNISSDHFVKEKDSLLLQCPHDPRLYSSAWYKNDIQLFSTDKVTIFPDGSFHISRTDIFDEGEYECKITGQFSNCTESIKINVIVEASASSACGYQHNKDHQPWTVSLWWKDETLPFCYGSFIHENWVLTAAQCLSGIFRKKFLDAFVRFGYESVKRSSVTRDIPFALVKIHPMFSKKLYVNDIGLVKLKEKVSFTENHLPTCLPLVDFTVKNPCDQDFSLEGTVSGWGPLEKDNIDRSPLKTESVKVLPLSDCQSCNCESSYSNKLLCTTKSNESLPTFAGDSGSPLVIESEGRMYLLGIFSWGERMAQLGKYDYFTKVSIYTSWIEANIHTY